MFRFCSVGLGSDEVGSNMSLLEQLQQGLDSAGQAHVLRFWSELSEEQQQVLLQDLVLLDLPGLKRHCEAASRAAAAPPSSLDRDMEPLPPEITGSVRRSDPQFLRRWEDEGEPEPEPEPERLGSGSDKTELTGLNTQV